MRIVEYNGREIKTNLGGNYPFCDGNDKKTMRMYISDSIRESDEEMFERIAKKGYTRITFYYTTTRIRGIYHLIAFAK